MPIRASIGTEGVRLNRRITPPSLVLNISNYELRIPIDKILYVEKIEHHSIIVTETKSLDVYKRQS